MIEDFARIIARIVLFRETKKYVDAKFELGGLSKLVTGFETDQLKALGAEGIKYVFGKDKDTEAEKIYCSARILKEDGLILESEGNNEESLKSFKIAKELFKVASRYDFKEKEEAEKEFEELKEFELKNNRVE
jgi:hypothetical protein